MTIRPLRAADIPLAEALLRNALGGRSQARRGELVDVLEGASGLVALDTNGAPTGLVTWFRDGDSAEVRAVAVDAAARGQGVARALMEAAARELRAAGVRRAWLVTTNDNIAAMALYQKAGWRLSALRAGAVDEARRTIKPSIPAMGQHGIPLHDELELELDLQAADGTEIPRYQPGS